MGERNPKGSAEAPQGSELESELQAAKLEEMHAAIRAVGADVAASLASFKSMLLEFKQLLIISNQRNKTPPPPPPDGSFRQSSRSRSEDGASSSTVHSDGETISDDDYPKVRPYKRNDWKVHNIVGGCGCTGRSTCKTKRCDCQKRVVKCGQSCLCSPEHCSNREKLTEDKRHADGSLPSEDFDIVLEDQSGKIVQMGTETDQGSAATALSKRHADGSLLIEDFSIVLEDQSGKKVQMGTETDQRMLHTNAKQLIKAQNYQDALEVLTMGELQVPDESLSLVMSMGFRETDAKRAQKRFHMENRNPQDSDVVPQGSGQLAELNLAELKGDLAELKGDLAELKGDLQAYRVATDAKLEEMHAAIRADMAASFASMLVEFKQLLISPNL